MTRCIPAVCDARIVERREYAPGIFFLSMHAPAIATTARPGQFVMVRIPGVGTDPLLRRPFSLCGVGKDTLHLLVQVRGKGTALLAASRTGQTVQVTGPHGNGFTAMEHLQEAVLVAGGIGIAPLLFLAHDFERHEAHVALHVFYGTAQAAAASVIDHFPSIKARCTIATEDGGRGVKGLVTDALEAYWTASRASRDHICVYGCGPRSMLTRLAEQARDRSVMCQVSLEEMMACGVGACMGCVTEDRAGDYRRVCVDGPVFDAGCLW